MLAWDIETTGFSGERDLVTVAALYDGSTETVFCFVRLINQGTPNQLLVYKEKDELQKLCEEFCGMLDAAPMLATFNGVRFDIRFVQSAFKIPESRIMGWLMKTFDVFDICASCASRTFALNLLLDLNGFATKSGSGDAAVKQAQAGEFEALKKYCQDDASLTHQISTMQRIALPEGFAWRKKNGNTHDKSNMLFLIPNYNEHENSLKFGFILETDSNKDEAK
jgi:hypothetical protein